MFPTLPSPTRNSPRRALSVRDLGKCYRVARTQAHPPTTLAEALLRAARGGSRTHYDDFWANRGISFDLHEGDVLGVVGRNGAGKSTLLKLLSRITEPTTGAIDLYGRVGSLLEVGTGFHPELTGRENIGLNGAILGMTRREIAGQFDAIVDFAGIAPFLDTPVKRYSSGMYVRLAFAVAAHLRSEILIVDEVLAVGDAAFQRKCLGKLRDVAQSGGRAVLFVSHNTAAVRALCTRALLLVDGRLVMDDTPEAVSARYLAETETGRAERLFLPHESPSSDFQFVAVRVLDDSGTVAAFVDCREPFVVEIEYVVTQALPLRIEVTVQTPDGVLVCLASDPDWGTREAHAPGRYVSRCWFPAWTFNEGTFLLGVAAEVPNEGTLQRADDALPLRISDALGHGASGLKLPGLIRPRLVWEEPLSVALDDEPRKRTQGVGGRTEVA